MKRIPTHQPGDAITGRTARLPRLGTTKGGQPKEETETRSARVAPWAAGKAGIVDQAYDEYCVRREAGETLDAEAYCDQFPAVKSSLCKLIQAHLFLEKNPGLCTDEASAIRWPEAEETFLDYDLLLLLGRGAFSRVFLARQRTMGQRLVAVKIAMKGAAEAAVLGPISHPNIVPVYSVQQDECSGLTAVCMPYLGSATLHDVLDTVFSQAEPRRRATLILDAVGDLPYPLPDSSVGSSAADPILRRGTFIDGVRFLGTKLAEALAFIHGRGICHRDIKPSNVLLSPDGTPMLLDFNLSADAKTAPDQLGGTLPYMSPEQLRATDPDGAADASLLDARSDIFSLGVILYQLLTGKHPFGPLPMKMSAREMREQLLCRQSQGPIPACQVNPDIEQTFSALIQSCLAEDAHNRPQSAAEVVVALRQELTPLRRARRWVCRHPRRLIAGTILLLALGLAAVSAPTRSAPGDDPLSAGIEFYRKGDYRQAVHHFDAVLSAEPDNAAALFARGRAYQQMAATDENLLNLAFKNYENADKLAPAGKTKACLGYCANALNMPPTTAITYYESAIKSGHATAAVYNNLGYSLQVRRDPRQNDLEKARKNLDHALHLDRQLQAAYGNRALVNLHQALNDMTKLLLPVPAEHKKKIQGKITQGLHAGIQDIEKALKLGPATAELHRDAARLYAQAVLNGEPKKAAAALEHLAEAVKRGIAPQKLTEDSLFAPLATQVDFQALLAKPAPLKSPQPAQRFVDPIEDLPRATSRVQD